LAQKIALDIEKGFLDDATKKIQLEIDHRSIKELRELITLVRISFPYLTET
jgi:hypothetical protein